MEIGEAIEFTNPNELSMSNSSARILPSFKNMKQRTMGETYKYLNNLLKGKSFNDFDNIVELLSPETPLPMFEESLRLIIIDSFHLENEVVKILLSQDDYSIKRILKCDWFFKKLTSARYYITQIIPIISASLRYKIVTKLSKYLTNENEAEELFVFLQNNYSVRLAEKLLPNCSREFISNYVNQVKQLFGQSSRTVLNISKKHPEIGIQIMFNLFEVGVRCRYYDYKKVFQYLAFNKIDVFTPFIVRHHSKMRLGSRIQLKLKECPLKPHEVIYSKIYNTKYLFKNLSIDDQVKFLSGLVTRTGESFIDWEACADNITPLLVVVPPSKRLTLIETVFKEVYNSDFFNYPEAWSLEMLALIPNKQRQPFVQKLDKAVNEVNISGNIEYMSKEPESYVCLYEFSIAFTKFKEILSKAASPYRRQAILNQMVECCSINRDVSGLEEVIDFVRTSQRNNDPRILSEFLGTIVRLFPKTDFTLETWGKLQEIAHICAMKNQMEVYEVITEKHILHRLEMKENVQPYYKNYFELYVLKCVNSRSFMQASRSEHSRALYFAICREILNWIQANPSEINVAENLLRSILKTCEEFNKYNKGKIIRVGEVPSLNEELENQLLKRFGDVGGEDWSPDIWDKFHAVLMDPTSKMTILYYILKENVGMNQKNLEGIVNYLMTDSTGKTEKCLIRSKKALSFLEVSDTVKEMFLKELQKGKSTIKRNKALTLYSHMCSLEEFSEAIADYLPKTSKIDVEVDSRFTGIQLDIPVLLRNVRPRYKNLDLISKFFVGDFLISVLPSFHACVCCTRADMAVAFLKERLSKLPFKITFTKNVIRLMAEVSTRSEIIDFCSNCWENNTHHSVRTVLLTFISKYFLDLPTEEGFQALEKCILESDEFTIQARPKIYCFPSKFLMSYVTALWKFTEPLAPKVQVFLQAEILGSFNRKNIGFLSNEFCENIIQNNLFKATHLNVEDFTIYYLVSEEKYLFLRTKMLLEMLNTAGLESDSASSFLKTLVRISMQDSKTFSEVLDFLLVNWPPYPPYVLYEERLMLTYYCLYHKIVRYLDNHLEKFQLISIKFGKELKNFYSGLSHSSAVTVILVESLNNFFRELKSANRSLDVVLVVKELVRGSDDLNLAIVGISVIPDDVVRSFHEDDNFDYLKKMRKKDLCELIDILKQFDDNILLIYLTKKFGYKALEQNQ